MQNLQNRTEIRRRKLTKAKEADIMKDSRRKTDSQRNIRMGRFVYTHAAR
jgi:hypothetical protein